MQPLIRTISGCLMFAVLVGSVLAVADNSSSIGLIAKYTLRATNCLSKTFPANQTTLASVSLLRNENITTCEPSMGISSLEGQLGIYKSRLYSNFTLQKLLSYTNGTKYGILLELWIKPQATTFPERSLPIMTIGRGVPPTADNPVLSSINYCDAYNLDFQLTEQNGYLAIYYRTSSIFLEPCKQFIFEQENVTVDKLTHVAIFLSSTSQQVYINGHGSITLSEDFNNSLSHWNSTSVVYFFDYPGTTGVWPGKLYQASFYNLLQQSTYQSITTGLISSGLPPSSPFAFNYTTIINEDAEVNASSHTAEWYRQSPTVDEASQISVLAGSIDQEVAELKTRLGINASITPSSTYVYIVDVPDIGQLYTKDGLQINQQNSLFALQRFANNYNWSVVYIPPLDEYSKGPPSRLDVFTTINYCVSGKPLFSIDQCQSIGSISVCVKPVNDPPITIQPPLTNYTEALLSTSTAKIKLTGSDVDLDDGVSSVEIIAEPQYGRLLLHVGEFRADNISHGTPLSDLQNFVNGSEPVYVMYLWNASKFSGILGSIPVSDEFSFRVADKQQTWSAGQAVKVQISTSLFATPPEIVDLFEDKDSNVTVLTGSDRSGYNRSKGFIIELVPTTIEGTVYLANYTEPLKAGDQVTFDDSTIPDVVLPIYFDPSHNFCSNKLDQMPQVKFRLVAFDSNGELQSVSESMYQNFSVHCVIDSLRMKVKKSSFHIIATNWKRIQNKSCSGSFIYKLESNFTEECKTFAIIQGIEVFTIDEYDSDVIVSIACEHGYLSLGKAGWNKTSLIVGRRGHSANNITFTTPMKNLNKSLATILYESTKIGLDTIDLVLLYGNCTTEQIVRYSRKSTSCQILHHSFQVNVSYDKQLYITSEYFLSKFPWQMIVCVLGFPLLYLGYRVLEDFYLGFNHKKKTVDEEEKQEETWKQHMSPGGMYYYESSQTGEITWRAPVGKKCALSEED